MDAPPTNEEIYTTSLTASGKLGLIQWYQGPDDRKYAMYVLGKYLQHINHLDLDNISSLKYISVQNLSKKTLDNIWQGWCAKGNKHQTDIYLNAIDKLNNQIKQKDNEILQQAKQIKQQHEDKIKSQQKIKQLDNKCYNQNEQLIEKERIIMARTNLNKRLIDTLLIYKHKQPDGPVYDYKEIKARKQILHSEFKRLSKLMRLG